MKYLTIQQIQFIGDLACFDARIEELQDALLDLEDGNDAIEDPDLAAHLSNGHVDVQMVIEATDPAEAMVKALCTTRAAIHAIGDATPGWETQRAVMHVAPADDSDRLFADA